MTDSKERLSVSVDAALADEPRRAVAEGRAVSISSWVSDALRLQTAHDARPTSTRRVHCRLRSRTWRDHCRRDERRTTEMAARAFVSRGAA